MLSPRSPRRFADEGIGTFNNCRAPRVRNATASSQALGAPRQAATVRFPNATAPSLPGGLVLTTTTSQDIGASCPRRRDLAKTGFVAHTRAEALVPGLRSTSPSNRGRIASDGAVKRIDDAGGRGATRRSGRIGPRRKSWGCAPSGHALQGGVYNLTSTSGKGRQHRLRARVQAPSSRRPRQLQVPPTLDMALARLRGGAPMRPENYFRGRRMPAGRADVRLGSPGTTQG